MAKNDFRDFWLTEPTRSYDPITVTSGFDWSILPSIGIKRRKRMKVIFNDPATILFVDDKKFVSKAHKEKFDPEKGLLMCLAKANGISHLELIRLMKNANWVSPETPYKKKEKKEDK